MHLYKIPELHEAVEKSPSVKWLTTEFLPVVDQVMQIFPWVHYTEEWGIFYPETADFIQLEGSVGGGARLQVFMITSHQVSVTLSSPPKLDESLRETLFNRTFKTDRISLTAGLSIAANHLTKFLMKRFQKFSAWKILPDEMNPRGMFFEDILTNQEYCVLSNTTLWLSPSFRTAFVPDGEQAHYGVEDMPVGHPFWLHLVGGETLQKRVGVRIEKCATIPEVVSVLEIEDR